MRSIASRASRAAAGMYPALLERVQRSWFPRERAGLAGLAAAAGDVTLGQAAEAYLATLGGAEQASTRRTYGRILRGVAAEFGAGTGPGEVGPERFTGWFTATGTGIDTQQIGRKPVLGGLINEYTHAA